MGYSCVAAVALDLAGPDVGADDASGVCLAVSGREPALFADEDAADIELAADGLPADTLWISHDAERAGPLLRRLFPAAAKRGVVDTRGIAAILFPGLSCVDLVPLCEALGADPCRDGGLAAAGANTLLAWDRLAARIGAMPPALRGELARLFARVRGHPYRDVFKLASKRAEDPGGAALRDLFVREGHPPRRQLMLAEVRTGLDPAKVAAVFEPGGPLARELPGYEARPQQTQMAQAVAAAFGAGRSLLAEAGTGVGKSLAYLVPSVMWSALNELPVVVSTSTKNLQSQLMDKDVPLLSRILGTDFKATVIKGRRNYVCLRKLLFLLRHASDDLGPRQRVAAAAVLAWATTTDTGDLDECSACLAPGVDLHGEVTSAGGECHGPSCEHRSRCFLYRARRKALAADVVIANHAVVLAEVPLGDGSAVLPPHRQIVFDEAHNLEDAATAAFSVEVSSRRLAHIMGRLWRGGGRAGGGHGLAPLLARRLESAERVPPDDRARALKALERIGAGQAGLWAGAEAFLSSLAALLPGGAGRETVRLHVARVPAADWDEAVSRKTPFAAALGDVAGSLDTALGVLRTLDEEALDEQADFSRQLEGSAAEVRQFMTDLDFVLEARDEGYVYWVARLPAREGGACAWAAPIAVGRQLHEMLYAQKHSIIFTSATLSAGGSMQYVRRRLGIDRLPPENVDELTLGSPFEFERQCLAMTPTFLPEPDDGQAGYPEALARLMADLFRLTRGRALGLFTSYDMLTRTARALRRELAGDGIPILVQGESGSREAILETFRTDGGAVLLGTHSFWEGIDVVGEALSCLVVARLPFAVFTDPIVEARCQQVEAGGESAFVHLSVPNAVIKLRQGFGRLIRSRQDRGIAVIADRRIISRRYGTWFRRSLPAPLRAVPDRDEFLAAVTAFFECGA